MLSTTAVSLSGMHAAFERAQVAAHNIANLGTTDFRPQQVQQSATAAGGVTVTLSQDAVDGGPMTASSGAADLVDLLAAKSAFFANLSVFRAGDLTMGTLLDAVS